MQTRTHCIFCQKELSWTLFEEDLKNYTGHYAVDMWDTASVEIPYNICVCNGCNTPQMKYLGDLDEIYRINHADSTGRVMRNMHTEFLKLLTRNRDDITGIMEIGSSKGVLADKVIEEISVPYTAIDPAFFGSRENKTVVDAFYEDVDDSEIDANTLIMSHVFEHFYNPLEILEKVSKNENIEHIFLVFPNLEAYLKKGILHVLNIEHTYYADNDFLGAVFARHGFVVCNKAYYDDHSVFFHLRRSDALREIPLPQNKHDLKLYFSGVARTVKAFNEAIEDNQDKNIYLFPASIHSIFLTIFGLKHQQLTAMIDNSPLKIGKRVYGLNTPIIAFDSAMNINALVLLNGGVFNKEVIGKLEEHGVEYRICPE